MTTPMTTYELQLLQPPTNNTFVVWYCCTIFQIASTAGVQLFSSLKSLALVWRSCALIYLLVPKLHACVVIRFTGFIFGSNYILGTFPGLSAASWYSAGDLVTLSPWLLFNDCLLLAIKPNPVLSRYKLYSSQWRSLLVLAGTTN